jgi:hypothetical protein
VLGMLYAVLAHESPALLPTAEELAWVAELGEETAVDVTCAALDRAARLLLDGDRWHLWSRVEAALAAGDTSPDRRVRDTASIRGRDFRSVSLRGSVAGARHIVDALLVEAYEGHPPGTRVVLTGALPARTAVVVGVHWPPTGPPARYDVRTDEDATVLTVPGDDLLALPDQPAQPEPAAT